MIATGDFKIFHLLHCWEALKMTSEERLKRIAEIIEAVDDRCLAADGPITPTLQEMTQAEISEIYKLASQQTATISHIGFCLDLYDKDTCNDCPTEKECLELRDNESK